MYPDPRFSKNRIRIRPISSRIRNLAFPPPCTQLNTRKTAMLMLLKLKFYSRTLKKSSLFDIIHYIIHGL